MYEVGRWSDKDKSELFLETAAKKGLPPTIVEKDFWVCWTLGHLFSDLKQSPGLIFKGGTSLSKVFQAINRFSEDIDLSVNREDLGFIGEKDILLAETGNKKKNLGKELTRKVDSYLREDVQPRLRSMFTASLGTDQGWNLSIHEESDNKVKPLLFTYPVSLIDSYLPEAPIQPRVMMEFGGTSDHFPSKAHDIRPYAAEEFANLFAEPTTKVVALAPERTFWEKALSLHDQFYRSPEKFKGKFSRHYYDVVLLARRGIASRALSQKDVYESARQNKIAFWHWKGHKYDLAAPGTFKLVPSEELLPLVEQGYADMREMFFPEPEPPSFGKVIEELRSLENEINNLDWA